MKKQTMSQRIIESHQKIFNELSQLGSNPSGPEFNSATHSPARRYLERLGFDAKSTLVYYENRLAEEKVVIEDKMEGVGEARVKIDESLNSQIEDFTDSQRYMLGVAKLNRIIFIWVQGILLKEFEIKFNPDVNTKALKNNKQANLTQAVSDYANI
tara:strand:+ start:12722 stop:13189 length:468 start_codon:yes stop_codon:yes gene_type:complete